MTYLVTSTLPNQESPYVYYSMICSEPYNTAGRVLSLPPKSLHRTHILLLSSP
jgi:hypothetical protein